MDYYIFNLNKRYNTFFYEKICQNINIYLIFLLIIISANQKVFEIYFSHKLSKWLDKDIKFTNFSINYPNEISLSNLEIKNSNPVFYESIFETKQVVININVKSFLFYDLVIINSLKIENEKGYRHYKDALKIILF